MKATPGPWRYTRTHHCSNDAWYVITDAQGYGPIFEVGGKDFSGQIAEAKYLITDKEEIEVNAAFIVRACNAHEELLDLLKSAIARVELANAEGNNILSAWLPDARAAIRAAEGEGKS